MIIFKAYQLKKAIDIIKQYKVTHVNFHISSKIMILTAYKDDRIIKHKISIINNLQLEYKFSTYLDSLTCFTAGVEDIGMIDITTHSCMLQIPKTGNLQYLIRLPYQEHKLNDTNQLTMLKLDRKALAKTLKGLTDNKVQIITFNKHIEIKDSNTTYVIPIN